MRKPISKYYPDELVYNFLILKFFLNVVSHVGQLPKKRLIRNAVQPFACI